MKRDITLAVVVFCAGTIPGLPVHTAFAQSAVPETPASPRFTFDAAAIRPMTYDDNARTHIANSPHNGSIKAVNVNLKALLEVAWDVPDTRMYGGPAWTETEKFDLNAGSESKLNEQIAALSTEQGKQAKRQMLQALLADRFQLKVHTEMREMPIYALVVAKGGAKLSTQGTSGATVPGLSSGRGRIAVQAANDALAILAYELSWRLGRPVIDRTGLQGKYNLTLEWAEDGGTSAGTVGPSLFTAIQEQLGLRLESTRGPVQVLIIDHAERPSEN